MSYLSFIPCHLRTIKYGKMCGVCFQSWGEHALERTKTRVRGFGWAKMHKVDINTQSMHNNSILTSHSVTWVRFS